MTYITEVVWSFEVPSEVQVALAPYIERYLDLLPSWCLTLKILPSRPENPSGDEPTDFRMAVVADYKYRIAKLFVDTDFLTMDDEEREQTVIHEFVHVLNAPLIDFTDQLIAIVEGKSPDSREMLNTLQEAGMEAATEDTARVLWLLTKDRRVDVD